MSSYSYVGRRVKMGSGRIGTVVDVLDDRIFLVLPEALPGASAQKSEPVMTLNVTLLEEQAPE